MKSVVLLRRTKDAANTGVGLYANSLAGLLERNSIEFEEIEMRMDLHNGFIRMLKDGFIEPFFKIMKARKDTEIFHATDDLCCFFLPFMRKNKKLVTFHHVVSEKDKDIKFLPMWRLSAWIGVKLADKIVAISEQTRDEIKRRYKINGDNIVVVPIALSDDITTLDVEKKRYIGCVSTLIQRKNIESLLRAFKEFRDICGMKEGEGYSLRICGKGPEENTLRALANDLGLEGCVEFISDIDSKELVLFYNEASIIANPSLHEGFGKVTLEAQLCSTPVVYFKEAEIPEEVVRYAVASTDESDFAQKMFELLSDSTLYKKVVEEGLEYARSFQGTQAKMLDIYKELSDK